MQKTHKKKRPLPFKIQVNFFHLMFVSRKFNTKFKSFTSSTFLGTFFFHFFLYCLWNFFFHFFFVLFDSLISNCLILFQLISLSQITIRSLSTHFPLDDTDILVQIMLSFLTIPYLHRHFTLYLPFFRMVYFVIPGEG